ncbi:putative PTP1-interacting protein, 39 kDa [Trypanosoma cruzi]|uniref:PTP1-interacting protein, 39 kDa n=3 Tax=Trypanosoma cruzi TaxID=5693 RepID=Q4D4C0_TRYCC|nr:hypothetical protein, conserved [Trypanosoma cruzi]EAN87370.1 hypothetical protein, conserved [Trypanosoma cruzi]PWV18365.1 putative PTP1-interacting protein, 39 kDa [Trypanosoma cruzi]|eukprot:XP_809221.1 hypothetical protein [Trypanosoma cruzi strain CL Brener]
MPHVLFSSLPRVAVDALRYEEQEKDEEGTELIAHNNDMDFFMDDYVSLDVAKANATAASKFVEDEEAMIPPRSMAQPKHSCEKNEGVFAVDCDVCLQLSGAAGEGCGGRFIIRVPAALPVSNPSISVTPCPVNETTARQMKPMCGKDTMVAVEEVPVLDAGAAWTVRGEGYMNGEVSEEEDGAAFCSSCYAVNSYAQHGSIIPKTILMPSNNCEHLINAGNVTITVSAEEQKQARGGECVVVHAMKLPLNFVLGLRLSFELERALVKYYQENRTSSSAPPPVWLSAFLYTTALRSEAFTSPISTLSPSIFQEWLGESTAVATLEGFCIVALNIIAQMGHLRRQKLQETDDIDETTMAQRGLLHGNQLFSASQKERVRCWLQRYIPLEAYDGSEESETTLRRPPGCFLWPSAVTVVFHIALDLAKFLFPSLLLNLESTILAALQPLLEARTLESMSTPFLYVSSPVFSPCTPSLRWPQSRRQALFLLTQLPSAWWSWWRRNKNDERSNNDCGISAICASRGYAALRVLQCFTCSCLQSTPDESCHLVEGDDEEECELAQFLLSAEALFAELLLDREVANVIERTIKGITWLYHISLERLKSRDAVTLPLQTTRASMRYLLVLVCWLTFRPKGYCTTLAQHHFGSLLRLAAMHHERCQSEHLFNMELEEEGETMDREQLLLRVCSREYFLLLSNLLCHLRDRCGTRRHRGDYATAPRENPWQQLRQGKMSSRLFANDEDGTTNTSHSHPSVASFSTTNAATESLLAPQPPTARRTAILHNDALPSHSLYTLRRVIRAMCHVIRRLERDVLEECDTSALTSLGTKRMRNLEENVFSNLRVSVRELKFGVTPYFARHLCSQPNGRFWEWHLEISESSDEDATDTSASGSG